MRQRSVGDKFCPTPKANALEGTHALPLASSLGRARAIPGELSRWQARCVLRARRTNINAPEPDSWLDGASQTRTHRAAHPVRQAKPNRQPAGRLNQSRLASLKFASSRNVQSDKIDWHANSTARALYVFAFSWLNETHVFARSCQTREFLLEAPLFSSSLQASAK